MEMRHLMMPVMRHFVQKCIYFRTLSYIYFQILLTAKRIRFDGSRNTFWYKFIRKRSVKNMTELIFYCAHAFWRNKYSVASKPSRRQIVNDPPAEIRIADTCYPYPEHLNPPQPVSTPQKSPRPQVAPYLADITINYGRRSNITTINKPHRVRLGRRGLPLDITTNAGPWQMPR